MVSGKSKHAIVRTRVTPRSSRSELMQVQGTTLHIRVAAPPVEGAANKAVIEFIADLLSIPKSQLLIKSGGSSRNKILEIFEMTQDAVDSRIAGLSTTNEASENR